jgi:hypothetical protein
VNPRSLGRGTSAVALIGAAEAATVQIRRGAR